MADRPGPAYGPSPDEEKGLAPRREASPRALIRLAPSRAVTSAARPRRPVNAMANPFRTGPTRLAKVVQPTRCLVERRTPSKVAPVRRTASALPPTGTAVPRGRAPGVTGEVVDRPDPRRLANAPRRSVPETASAPAVPSRTCAVPAEIPSILGVKRATRELPAPRSRLAAIAVHCGLSHFLSGPVTGPGQDKIAIKCLTSR